MQKNWKKEVARDTLALGSIPFYFIVIIRAVIGQYLIFIYQLLIAALVLFLLLKIKKSNAHIARGFILAVFTSLFYKENLYTTFAFLLWIVMIISANYLKIKKNEIFNGIIFGIIAGLASYFLSPQIMSLMNY